MSKKEGRSTELHEVYSITLEQIKECKTNVLRLREEHRIEQERLISLHRIKDRCEIAISKERQSMKEKVPARFATCKYADCTRTARFLVANMGRDDDYYVYPSCEECYRKELLHGARIRIVSRERPRRLWMNNAPLPLSAIKKYSCRLSNLLSKFKKQ